MSPLRSRLIYIKYNIIYANIEDWWLFLELNSLDESEIDDFEVCHV